MAGDWIKMRTNLWDDPRVSNLCDLTGCSEAAVIGGLYWLWATADDHSADGELHGLTLAAIARKTGVPNLGAALCQIGWIEEIDGGVRLIRFSEHNGASAKKRAQTGKRVANHRSNAEVTQYALQDEESCVTGALAREEKKREEITPPTKEAKQQASEVGGAVEVGSGASPVSRAIEIAVYLRQRGVIGANSVNPNIAAWGDDIRVTNEILDAALSVVASRKLEKAVGPNYLVGIIADLLAPKPVKTAVKADDWHRSEAGIKRKARELGFGDGRANETWDSLKARCWDEIARRKREGVAA
ncbi:hypothetical protein [Burkholderia orbicola]|uniref:hypothetical protein n=1 Tax=Burkholderia orbicola TaxID=2978683 RepID=UPI002FE1D471